MTSLRKLLITYLENYRPGDDFRVDSVGTLFEREQDLWVQALLASNRRLRERLIEAQHHNITPSVNSVLGRLILQSSDPLLPKTAEELVAVLHSKIKAPGRLRKRPLK